MDRPEFDRWYRHHGTHYPGVRRWMAKEPDSAGIVAAWLQLLEPYTASEAIAASDRMSASGNTWAFADHARIVACDCRDARVRASAYEPHRYAVAEDEPITEDQWQELLSRPGNAWLRR